MVRCLVCLVLLTATAVSIVGCDNASTGGNTPPKQNLPPAGSNDFKKPG